MPTSGDLKSGDSLFFTTSPPLLHTPDKYGNDKGHYMNSYMSYMPSKFTIIILMPDIIFVSD